MRIGSRSFVRRARGAPAVVLATMFAGGITGESFAQADPCAGKWKQTRLLINVLAPIDVDDNLKKHLRDIVDQMNGIMKQTGACVWFVYNADTDLSTGHGIGDGDADIESADELKEMEEKGKAELKGRFNGKGYKVFLANRIGNPGPVALTPHPKSVNGGPVEPITIFTLNPVLPGAKDRAHDLAHEISHALTLGKNHRIDPNLSATDDGHHPTDKDNLMYPRNPVDPNNKPAGNGLTPDQVEEVRKGADAISKIKSRRTDGSLVNVLNGFGYWSDARGEVAEPAIDLLAGSLFLAEGSTDIKLELEFGSLHSESSTYDIEVVAMFDTDDNTATGVVDGSFEGIDRILEMRLQGAFPFSPPAGQFTAEIRDPVANTTTPIPVGEVMRMVGHQDDFTGATSPPLLDLQDAVEQILPISLLGQLADQFPVGLRSRDLFSNETDEVSTIFEVMPSGLPILEASRYAGIPGDPLHLTGLGFAPSTMVRITIGSIEYRTVQAAPDGSFAAFLPVPAVSAGLYYVTALDDVGNYDFSVLNVLQDPLAGAAPQGIPALSTWGLAALVMLMTFSGAALIFRRHGDSRDDRRAHDRK